MGNIIIRDCDIIGIFQTPHVNCKFNIINDVLIE